MKAKRRTYLDSFGFFAEIGIKFGKFEIGVIFWKHDFEGSTHKHLILNLAFWYLEFTF